MSTSQQELLVWSGVTFTVESKDALRSADYLRSLDGFVIYDGNWNPQLAPYVDLWVWRGGYRHPPAGVPCLDLEGPSGLWPVVLLDDDEIVPRAQARAELQLPAEAFVTGVVPSTRLLRGRVPPDSYWMDGLFPALRWFRAFDQLAIAPGWTFAECIAAGVPIVDCGDDLGGGDSQRARIVGPMPPFTPNAARVACQRVLELVGHTAPRAGQAGTVLRKRRTASPT